MKLINIYDGSQIGQSGGNNFDSLLSGETREIKAWTYASLNENLDDAACVIALKSGNTILDEWTRSIG